MSEIINTQHDSHQNGIQMNGINTSDIEIREIKEINNNTNICQYDLGQKKVIGTFSSSLEAAKILFPNQNGVAGNIDKVLDGKRSTCYGYAWYLKSKVNEFKPETIIHKPQMARSGKRKQMDTDARRWCIGHKALLANSEFGTSKTDPRCLECRRTKKAQQVYTKELMFTRLVGSARSSSKTRFKKGRTVASECTITVQEISELWESQQGKCYYSNILMSYDRKSDWQNSLERLDPNKGYIKGNVVLCALEFNGVRQWSLEKINHICRLVNVQVNIHQFYEHLKNQLSPRIYSKIPKQPIQTIIINNVTFKICHKCGLRKSPSEWSESKKICKACRKIYQEMYYNTLKGFLCSLIRGTRSSSKSRNSKNTACKRIKLSVEEKQVQWLTLNDLCEKTLNQSCKCAYSGIPLVFKPKSNYQASIERIDPKKDYTKDNTIIICAEFNSFCNRGNGINRIGDSNWTRHKFQLFYKSIFNQEAPHLPINATFNPFKHNAQLVFSDEEDDSDNDCDSNSDSDSDSDDSDGSDGDITLAQFARGTNNSPKITLRN